MHSSRFTHTRKHPSIFGDIDENQFSDLLKLAKKKKLQEGEILRQPKEAGQTLFVVLEGRLKAECPKRKTGVDIQKGDLFGKMFHIELTPESYIVKALSPVMMLEINRRIMDAMDAKIQLAFYSQIIKTAESQIRMHRQMEKMLAQQNKLLTEAIFQMNVYTPNGEIIDYSKWHLIADLVDHIPQLPPYINDLSIKLQDKNASFRDIADIIKDDPSMVARILKTLNSPFYGFRNKIADIHFAINVLGFNELFQMVTVDSVKKTMPNTADFQELLSHSIAVSRIIFILAQRLQVGKPTQLGTVGMLHDIGLSVIHLLKNKNPKLKELIDTIDQTKLGSFLLRKWELADNIWQCVAYQSYPEFTVAARIPEAIRGDVALLYIAHLVYYILVGVPEVKMPMLFINDYKKLLGLERLSLTEILKTYVLPDLVKHREKYPLFLRNLIENYLEENEESNEYLRSIDQIFCDGQESTE